MHTKNYYSSSFKSVKKNRTKVSIKVMNSTWKKSSDLKQTMYEKFLQNSIVLSKRAQLKA